MDRQPAIVRPATVLSHPAPLIQILSLPLMNHSLSISLLLACSCNAIAGDAKSPIATAGDWEFSLSAGPAWRQSGTLDFSGGSRSAGVVMPSFVGDNVLIRSPIGADDTYDERVYKDGFVRADMSTKIDGLTGYWGYENSSQVNLGNDSIAFHASGFQSIRSDQRTTSAAPTSRSEERSIAPIIQFDAHYKREIAGFQPGISMSLGWNPVDFDQNWSDFSLVQTRDDFHHGWTDVYNLGGFGSLIPSAPYSGTMEGPGFLLKNIPDSRSLDVVQIGSEEAVLTNHVSTRFNADHTTLSFGPTMARQISPEWNLVAGMGISLHWLHWSAEQNEKLNVSKNGKTSVFKEWTNTASGNQLLGGLYLQLATEWMPKDQKWTIKGLLRGDLGQTFSMRLGPSHISYDTDGITAAVLFSHPL